MDIVPAAIIGASVAFAAVRLEKGLRGVGIDTIEHMKKHGPHQSMFPVSPAVVSMKEELLQTKQPKQK
jgi:hypothetical protein